MLHNITQHKLRFINKLKTIVSNFSNSFSIDGSACYMELPSLPAQTTASIIEKEVFASF